MVLIPKFKNFDLKKVRKDYFPLLTILFLALGVAWTKQDSDNKEVLRWNDALIEVVLPQENLSVSRQDILNWITAGGRAVSAYYGKFPVPRTRIKVASAGGGHGIHGRTFSGRRIEMRLGNKVNVADLKDDWTMTHEMFHLGFPQMDDAYDWMGEGLSTYLEPLARARVGELPVEKVWRNMIEGLPKGLPQLGDQGLDRTHTWGRTYWGGALFWFLADIEIREKTQNKKSLDDAMRAILAQGGDGSKYWHVEKVLEVGDQATGLSVLKNLHERLGLRPEKTDLGALWKRLGIQSRGEKLIFNDAAPLSTIRVALTQKGM